MSPLYRCPVCGWRFAPYFDWDGETPLHDVSHANGKGPVLKPCPGSDQVAVRLEHSEGHNGAK